jgi:hypothetical protein
MNVGTRSGEGERPMLFIVSQVIFWKHPSHKLATIKDNPKYRRLDSTAAMHVVTLLASCPVVPGPGDPLPWPLPRRVQRARGACQPCTTTLAEHRAQLNCVSEQGPFASITLPFFYRKINKELSRKYIILSILYQHLHVASFQAAQAREKGERTVHAWSKNHVSNFSWSWSWWKFIVAPLFSPLLAMRVSERGESSVCLPSQGQLKCLGV